MTARRRRARLALSLTLGPAALAACDLLLTEPAPATPEVQVAFQFDAVPLGGTLAAFSRIRRARLCLGLPGGPCRDTTVAAPPLEGAVRVRLILQPDQRADSLAIDARLGYGDGVANVLFTGSATVGIRSGEATSAVVGMVPAPARIVADRAQLTLAGPGASAQLQSAVLYVSGDTLREAQGLWTSEDPTVALVSPTGLVLAQQIGSTRLEVRLDTLADTVRVDVTPPPSRLRTWTNAGGGSWSDAASWSGGATPVAGDSVRINLAGTYTVTLDQTPPALAALTVGGAGSTATLATTGQPVSVAGNVTVAGTGTLELDATTLGAGTVQVAPSATLRLIGAAVVNAPVANGGLLLVDEGLASISGALTTGASSTIQVGGGTVASQLTVANGFTNNGSVDLGGSARLIVSAGTLVNPAGSSLSTFTTAIVGTPWLTAALDNAGSVSLAEPLLLDGPGATHVNSGSITSAASATLTVQNADAFDNGGTLDASNASVDVTLTGTGAGFVNTGSITVGAASLVTVQGGTFTDAGGSLTGAGGLQLVGSTGGLSAAATLGTTAPASLQLVSSTLTAPSLVVPNGSSLRLDVSTLDGALDNQGFTEIAGAGTSSITGALTTASGSTLRVTGAVGGTTLSLPGGFTANGVVQLATPPAGSAAELDLGGGTLTLSATGSINTIGAAATPRTINGDVSTVGAINLGQPLTITGRLVDPVGAPSTYFGNGNTLTVAGLDVDGAVFDDMPLASVGGALTLFQNVTFQTMDPAASQLSITHPGGARFTMTNLAFSTAPSTGFYIDATDADAIAPFLDLLVVGSTPASGLALSRLASGATLTW